MGVPLARGDGAGIVEFDEDDELEASDDDELARWGLLRGMNILATSSAFIALSPPWLPLAPHAERLICWKLGGFATAVIWRVVRRGPEW